MYIKGKKYKSRQNDMFIRLRNGYKGHDLCWYGNQDVFLSVVDASSLCFFSRRESLRLICNRNTLHEKRKNSQLPY